MIHLYHLTRLFFLVAILLFLSCRKDQESSVKVRFLNGGIADIYQAKAENISIGTLKSGEQTEYFSFNKINPDTGLPEIEFTGVINSEILGCRTSPPGWCGVDQMEMDGIYTCFVIHATVNGMPVFQLTFE